MTYRSSSKIVAIDQFLEELCPLRDFTVFRTFFSLLTDIHLIIFPLCAQLLHWNFVHSFISMTYRSSSKVVAIDQFLEELCPLRDFTVFRAFFLSAYIYSFDIWYIALPYQDTDQVWVWFWSIDCLRSYGPWTYRKITNYQFCALFFSYSFDILVHCFAIPRYRSSLSLVLIH
jgi:hypothetical protein